MINIGKAEAVSSLAPNADFTVTGDKLEWLDASQTQPTEVEIQAEIERLQVEYDANQYQRDRASEYPDIVDQLDTIYHKGVTGWKAEIKAIKDKYPKA